jgi:protein-tyrosine phosphatase
MIKPVLKIKEWINMKNILNVCGVAVCCISLSTMIGCNSDSDDSVAEPGVSLGIESVSNMRDMGGYTTTDGRVVKRGLVYRSNELYEITPDDMAKINDLGIKTVFDLRQDTECEAAPDELPVGANHVAIPVLSGMGASGEDPAYLLNFPELANDLLGNGQIEANFEDIYRNVISLPSAKQGYSEFFIDLGDENQIPAIFHCVAGKDRTGWAAAAFLSILGVPRDMVMENYLQSNIYLLPGFQDRIDAFVEAGGEESIALAVFSVQERYLNAAFAEVELKYGNIETYFSEGLNIDAEQQEAFREIYLED